MKSATQMLTMRTVNQTRPASTTALARGIALGLSLLWAAGCARDLAPAPERTWEEVRYHWSEGQTGQSYGDLIVTSSGQIMWDLQGEGAPTRGLLAGENLETLTRFIDALPPAGYAAQDACENRFFLTVSVDGSPRTYRSGDCDVDAPEELTALKAKLDRLVADAAHRLEVVPFRVLAAGEQSRAVREERALASNRDALLRVINSLGAGAPPVLPVVDFRNEVVIAVFMGPRTSAGYSLELAAAYRSQDGQIVLGERWYEPDPACGTAAVMTSPYLLVAVKMSSNDSFLSEIERVIRPCGAQGATE